MGIYGHVNAPKPIECNVLCILIKRTTSKLDAHLYLKCGKYSITSVYKQWNEWVSKNKAGNGGYQICIDAHLGRNYVEPFSQDCDESWWIEFRRLLLDDDADGQWRIGGSHDDDDDMYGKALEMNPVRWFKRFRLFNTRVSLESSPLFLYNKNLKMLMNILENNRTPYSLFQNWRGWPNKVFIYFYIVLFVWPFKISKSL